MWLLSLCKESIQNKAITIAWGKIAFIQWTGTFIVFWKIKLRKQGHKKRKCMNDDKGIARFPENRENFTR